jgi:hypothetical protein
MMREMDEAREHCGERDCPWCGPRTAADLKRRCHHRDCSLAWGVWLCHDCGKRWTRREVSGGE